jgi:hypothetical protein
MRDKLADFTTRSIDSDAAVIYMTGYGVEVGGTVYLLPGDYPVASRYAAFLRFCHPVSVIALRTPLQTVAANQKEFGE